MVCHLVTMLHAACMQGRQFRNSSELCVRANWLCCSHTQAVVLLTIWPSGGGMDVDRLLDMLHAAGLNQLLWCTL
jgi:hypothetical protein